jgi:cellulose synthase/poly-beta-1,6-N-acetylglucosamine synthase-like glycosyltransferase
MDILFWCLAAIIAYTYAGYPLVALAAGTILRRRVRKGDDTPFVSVIVAAYDEADGIQERIRNLLASEYPSDRLEVVIASDGSTDGTVALASAVDARRVRVLDLPRGGKAAALAAGAAQAHGDVLVFTDANTVFDPRALRALVRNLADGDVGGVAGHTTYRVGDQTESAGRGEGLYWRYDTWLKRLETMTGSVVSAHGGMHAVRRELFHPVEDPAVTDDFAISTSVVTQGKRLVFEPAALGYELPMSSTGSEFHRRVRLMTRGLRGILLRRELLNPFRSGFYAVAFASRKVLRRLLPLTFPLLLIASVSLADESAVYALFAGAQLSVLAAGALGWALRRTSAARSPLLYAPFFFCMANLASVVALWNVARGRRVERWTPQRHEGSVAQPFSPAIGGHP